MIALLSLLLACEPAPVARTSPARALGVVSRDLPSDLRDQALDALAADARRREARFLDAAEPGFLFQSTRADQAEIEAGLWSPGELFELGGQLFQVIFTAREGFGGADLPALRRFQSGERGGPDATHCASCHWRGGPAGAGDGADNAYIGGDGDHQSAALARNPRPLAGLGWVEIAAAEMTADLQRQRDDLRAAAADAGKPLRADLSSKGVSFGWLGALPDGTLDARGVEGVDPDLVVRPFGWKGAHADLRSVIELELATHHGMQSSWLAAHGPPERVGAGGGGDPDGDGVRDEISEGQVTALAAYLAMQEVPQVHLPTRQDMLAKWAEGQASFRALGCAGCHTPSIEVKGTIYEIPSREGGPPLRIDLAAEGAAPRLQPAAAAGAWTLHLYSDLRRHRMGAELAESRPQGGVDADLFLTPPLWGLARSRPYLHDGRAPTVEAAILAHGGEAQAARDAFAALPEAERFPLRLFLATLNRATRMVSP